MIKGNIQMNQNVRKRTLWHVPNKDSNQTKHEETLHPWLSKMRPVKILIRLYGLI